MQGSLVSKEEFRFEDLFNEDSEGSVNDDELPSPEATSSPTDKGVSALTLTFRQLQPPSAQGQTTDERAELEMRWARIHASGNLTRMGTSAPVWIPQRSFTWTAQQYDRLNQIDEEGESEIQRATTFVPPHLTVEQPVIQFSLNSGIAEKRAKLRAREKILNMTGFIEKEDQSFADVPGYRTATSELSREFGGASRPSAA